MSTDESLTTRLEAIRGRRERAARLAEIEEVSYADFRQVSQDADNFQAALEKVLELADDMDELPADFPRAAPSYWARLLREVITRTLTGEERDGGARDL